MLDQLPRQVWQDPKVTFLDPAMGGGQFLEQIVERLRAAGHANSNIRRRVFGVEANEGRVNFVRLKNLPIQTAVGGIDTDYGSVFGLKKIDVDCGNPPYVDSSEGEANIYHDFVNFNADYILKVLPSSWFMSDESNHKEFRNKILQYGLKWIKVHPMTIFGNGVNVKTASIYAEKGYKGPITVDHYLGFKLIIKIEDFNDKIIICSNQTFVSKLKNYSKQIGYKSKPGKAPVSFKRPENDYCKLRKDEKYKFPIIIQLSKTNHKYSYSSEVFDPDYNKYRVAFGYLTPGGYDKGTTHLGIVSVVEPGVQLAVSYRYIVCKNLNDAINLKRYLESKFVRYILYWTRTSRTLDNPQIQYIPYLNKKCINDEEIYNHFELNDREIRSIEVLHEEST